MALGTCQRVIVLLPGVLIIANVVLADADIL